MSRILVGNFKGPKGEKGDKGDIGETGANGLDGIYYGENQPTSPNHPLWVKPQTYEEENTMYGIYYGPSEPEKKYPIWIKQENNT